MDKEHQSRDVAWYLLAIYAHIGHIYALILAFAYLFGVLIYVFISSLRKYAFGMKNMEEYYRSAFLY